MLVARREEVDDGGDLADAAERDAVVVPAGIAGEPGAFGDGEDDTVGGPHDLVAKAQEAGGQRRSRARAVDGRGSTT